MTYRDVRKKNNDKQDGSDMIRVTVTIRGDGKAVLATGRLVARRKPV